MDAVGALVVILGGSLCLLFRWAFKTLPGEGWQILASVPRGKKENGSWNGLNLTYYGFFNATALSLAVGLWILLLGSAGVPLAKIAMIGIPLVALGFLASRWIARWVEKKPHTATIGGASFAVLLLTPGLVVSANRLAPGHPADALTVLGVTCIAYALGEGVGRLACISFGCCYGKPLAESHPLVRLFFARWNFIFSGKTKKIAYAHGLDGRRVIPIQALTSLLYSGAGLAGVYLFLKGGVTAAFILCLSVSQIWRVISEFFRADYRGGGSVSAYQIMAFLSIVYGFVLAVVLSSSAPQARDLWAGIRLFDGPGMLAFLQGVWVTAFLFTGRSMVTDSEISFHVVKERV